LEKIKKLENENKKPYTCEKRLENANFEQKLEKKRRNLEEKLYEWREEKYETMCKLKELIQQIKNLNIEVEVLSNYDKYFNLTEKIKSKLERFEIPEKKEKKITKKVTLDFEQITNKRSKIIVFLVENRLRLIKRTRKTQGKKRNSY
jgi:hypothetical protein